MNSDLIPFHDILHAKVEEYLAIRKVGVKPFTLTRYRQSLAHMERWMADNGGAVTPQSYGGFMEWVAKTYSSETARTMRTYIASFFKYCERMGYIQMSPDRLVPRFKKVPRDNTHSFIYKTDYAAIKLAAQGTIYEWGFVCAFNTGMSMVDVCNLRWDKVNLENITIRYQSKSGSRSCWPLMPGMHRWLKIMKAREVQQGKWKDYVSPDLARSMAASQTMTSRQFLRYLHKVRPECGFHDFRRTFLTKAVNDQVPWVLIGKMAGHTNINSLSGYVLPDIELLRSARAHAMDWEPKPYKPNEQENTDSTEEKH
jgi:integrase